MTASTPPDLAREAIRISFATNQAEQVAATRAMLRARPNWYALTALWGVVPLVLAIHAWLTEGCGATVFELILISAAGLVFSTYGMPWIAVRASRRGVRSPDGPFTWTLDDEGCRVEGPAIGLTLRWAAIVDTKETPHAFLLYTSRMQAYFIPMRAVSEADLPRLRSLLARVQPAAA